MVLFPSDSGLQWIVLFDQHGAESCVHCITGLQLRNLLQGLLQLMSWQPHLATQQVKRKRNEKQERGKRRRKK